MKLKRIYGATILFLIMINCSKDEEPSSCYLTSVTRSGTYGDLFYSYTDGKLTSFTFGTAAYTVEYDTLDRISTISMGSFIQSFSYNDVNQITSISFFERTFGTTKVDRKTDYIYNASGQLSQTVKYELISGGLIATGGSIYEYPNTTTHNPSVISNASNSLAYTYDNKHHPFTELKSMDPTIPTNNVTKEVNTITSTIRTFSYNYNSSGYPLSQTTETNSSTIKETTTYSYSNCN